MGDRNTSLLEVELELHTWPQYFSNKYISNINDNIWHNSLKILSFLFTNCVNEVFSINTVKSINFSDFLKHLHVMLMLSCLSLALPHALSLPPFLHLLGCTANWGQLIIKYYLHIYSGAKLS